MNRKGQRLALSAGILGLAVLSLAAYLSWPHLLFWYRFAPLGPNAQGYPEYRHRQTGIVFVRLPGGKFWMGAQKTDPKGQNYDPGAEENEEPVHEVTLSPFMIAKYEVTQARWEAVMGSNPSSFKGDHERPVELVSWNDIRVFGVKTGLLLPTEAQWEYACRAGTSTPFAGNGKLDDMGWHNENSGNPTHAVGKKAPNGFGLHDMHGNVYEWCVDAYNDYRNPDARKIDPVLETGSEMRVVRGGSWESDAGLCRSACRGGDDPAMRLGLLGFRPAYPVP